MTTEVPTQVVVGRGRRVVHLVVHSDAGDNRVVLWERS